MTANFDYTRWLVSWSQLANDITFFFRRPIWDLMLFKLAFHTYEAINYKCRLVKRRTDGSEADNNFETMSNRSDETVMTTTGPDSEAKFMKIEENLNIKLNNFIMKW